jgi:phage portal protein BeeE
MPGAFSSLAARQLFPGETRGRITWDQVFTRKEDGNKQPAVSRPNPIPGGSYGRSLTSSESAFKRLLQAMRSMAPGGWSDDRYSETRLGFLSIGYVAIHKIATMWMSSEFQVMEKDDNHPDGKRPVRKGHDAYKLITLLEKPNNYDSWGKICYRWAQQKYLTGTALTWMIPNVFGTPVEMYCVPTAIAIPQPAVNPDFPDGFYRIQPLYPYGPFSSYPTPASAVGAPIPSEWMLRFQFPHPLLRYEGYSPLTGLRKHLDAVEMMDTSRHAMMRRTIHPSAVINMQEMENMQPLPTSEIDRIVAEFEAAFMGPENQGHLMIAPPGGKIEPWGTTAEEMGYKDGWDQLTAFCLGGIGITKPVAGMTDSSSYAQLYAALKQFYFQELEPGLNDLAADITRSLAPFFGDDIIVEVRGKQKISSAVTGKYMTKNEARKMQDLPITTEPWGDEIVGFEKPQEQPGAAQPGEEMVPGAVAENETGGSDDQEFQQLEAEFGGEEENEPEKERPTPGPLGEGSLGPRKFLDLGKRKVFTNGHAKKLPKKLKRLVLT